MTKFKIANAADALRHIHRKADQNLYLQARTYGRSSGQCRSWKLSELGGSSGIDAFIEQAGSTNVGFNIALRRAPLDRCMGNDDAEVLSAFFIDLDEKSGGISSKEEALLFLQNELPFKPSLVVDSGGGLHAYFTLDQPLEINSDKDLEHASRLARAFEDFVHGEAETIHGWKLDAVSDLARIAGAPFSRNHKFAEPVLRHPISMSDELLCREQFDDLVSAHSKQGPLQRAPILSPVSATVKPQWQLELVKIEDQWIQAKTLELRSKAKGSIVESIKPNAAAIVEGCTFFRRFFEEPSSLAYNEWIFGLSILKHCFQGEDLAHQASSQHPGYKAPETQEKLDSFSKPVSCSKIGRIRGCNPCLFCPQLNSPIELGSRTSDEVKNLHRYAYVQETDEIFDLDRNEGISTDAFRKFYAERKFLLKHADIAFLQDGLAKKANKRTYDPQRPGEILIAEPDGTVKLNCYKPPVHRFSDQGNSAPFFEHLAFLVPNKDERKAVIEYLAHLVQKPWVKIRFGLVMIGGQGTGKSALIGFMQKVLGRGNVNAANGSSLLNRFQGHLSGGVLLFLEEVSAEGRREAYEDAKTLVTEDLAAFERKGKNIENLPTPRGLILLSNDRHALHLPKDDRRFFIVQTADHPHPNGMDYYNRVFDFSDDDAAAVYNDLNRHDISQYSPNCLPFQTAAKARMVESSRPEVEVLLQEMIECSTGSFGRDLVSLQDAVADIRGRTGDSRITEKRVRRALEDLGCEQASGQVRLPGGNRCRLWIVRNHHVYRGMTTAELSKAYDKGAARVAINRLSTSNIDYDLS